MKRSKQLTGVLGLSAVIIFVLALILFGNLNKEFSFFNDYVSKLGAVGEPNALGWNIIGFVVVGLLLFFFGMLYGKSLGDKLLSILLSLFGVGFAFTSIPFDMELSNTSVSKAHIVAICLGLACWLFGLSRMGYNPRLDQRLRNRANITALLLLAVMIGFVVNLWSMPIAHRLVFGIVFGWTAITSIGLLKSHPQA
jgi:hypothetical membrane protein